MKRKSFLQRLAGFLIAPGVVGLRSASSDGSGSLAETLADNPSCPRCKDERRVVRWTDAEGRLEYEEPYREDGIWAREDSTPCPDCNQRECSCSLCKGERWVHSERRPISEELREQLEVDPGPDADVVTISMCPQCPTRWEPEPWIYLDP